MAEIEWNDGQMAPYILGEILQRIYPDVFDEERNMNKIKAIYRNRFKIEQQIADQLYGSPPSHWRVVALILDSITEEGHRYSFSYEDEVLEWLDEN